MRDKTIVITGAFGVLGRAVAELAAQQGARVAMLDVKVGAQSVTAPELVIAADLTDLKATTRAMQSVRATTGAIDYAGVPERIAAHAQMPAEQPGSSADNQVDYLDIPAFLRRQAD